MARWTSYHLSPLPIGGAGSVTASVVPNVGEDIIAIRCIVGTSIANTAEDTGPDLVQANLESGNPWRAAFFGGEAVDGQIATWFYRSSLSGWVQGPVVPGIDLRPSWQSQFPWVMDWIVARLQEIARQAEPIPGRTVAIRRAFPRDTHALPSVSVHLDSATPTQPLLGDLRHTDGPLVGHSRVKGRLFSLGISIISWCATPEERSAFGLWLAEALSLVVEVAPYASLMEPSWSVEEGEDFEQLQVPLFLVRGSLSATVHSALTLPVRTGYGHISV